MGGGDPRPWRPPIKKIAKPEVQKSIDQITEDLLLRELIRTTKEINQLEKLRVTLLSKLEKLRGERGSI